ncbi:MAG: alpha/beta hydrolase [Pseudomonadota bacterium]
MKYLALILILAFVWPAQAELPDQLSALDEFLAQSEVQFDHITPGTEKTILWANDEIKKTDYAIVYLHGFSATRQETSPVTRNLAKALGANVFYTRLTGHGRKGEHMLEGSVKNWLGDIREAMTLGRMLGDEVIVVSVSTGSTLSTWIAAEEQLKKNLAAMVMISPNFALPDKNAYLLDLPYRIGITLGEMQVGEQVSWEPSNDLHGKYWTYSYPLAAIRELIRLLKIVEAIDKSKIKIPTLMIYSPNDKVVDVPAILSTYEEFGSPIKQLVPFDGADDPYQHVLAGDALSPSGTDKMTGIILEFLKGSNLAP